ncbi:MAG: hypothetical protein SGI83_15000 [Bacteroidota bacterium]|nr:hypothetical protein [Bacteroidota bacterium]
MRQLFIALFALISTNLLAQTKKIAFKSHSGKMGNFHIALENELFDTEEANFGLPPDIKTYQLDSVIYISENVTVIVKKKYSRPFHHPKDSAKLQWVKKDTLLNDPLFSKKHALDSIRTVLKTTGKYTNPVSNIVFMGYDNKTSGKKKEKDKEKNKEKTKGTVTEQHNIVPFVTTNDNDNNSPFDIKLALILGTILLVSLLGGWLSWKYYQPSLQKA